MQAKAFDQVQFLNQLKLVKADLIWCWCGTDPASIKFKSDVNERYYPGFAIVLKVGS